MNNVMQILNYNKTPIRTTEINGELWWVAKDVCDVLEIKNSRDSVSGLENDEKGVGTADTLGGAQEVQIVNESGIYNLIFKSRTRAALAFRKWVTHEVLPQIRKHGFFDATGGQPPEIAELQSLEYRKAALEAKLTARMYERKAKLVYHVDGAMPIIDWVREHCPALNTAQRANISRAIKRAIINQLRRPVGAAKGTNGGKVMAATPADIESAYALLLPTRPELKELN